VGAGRRPDDRESLEIQIFSKYAELLFGGSSDFNDLSGLEI
jgi:hypothetical protein